MSTLHLVYCRDTAMPQFDRYLIAGCSMLLCAKSATYHLMHFFFDRAVHQSFSEAYLLIDSILVICDNKIDACLNHVRSAYVWQSFCWASTTLRWGQPPGLTFALCIERGDLLTHSISTLRHTTDMSLNLCASNSTGYDKLHLRPIVSTCFRTL